MIETLYVIPSYRCNLNCSHCDIRNYQMAENNAAVIQQLQRIDFRDGIIFGGEPLLLDIGLLSDICRVGKIRSISTNLLPLAQRHIELFQEYDIKVATSWNPGRFNEFQFETWLKNIKSLVAVRIFPTILITLTESLFKSDIDFVLDQLNDIGNFIIKFEPYVPSSRDLIKKSDVWLTDLSSRWVWPSLTNQIFLDYTNGNILNCRGKWTLRPDGTLEHSCPTQLSDNIMRQCYLCEYRDICKPCLKQVECSFMKKFYRYVNFTPR